LPEIIEDGRNGLLVDFDTASSCYEDYGLSQDSIRNLEGAVIRMASDKEMRARMGAAGRAYAERAFPIDRVASTFEDVLSGREQAPAKRS